MYFEDVILSEISQHKKKNIIWFYLYEVIRVVKFIETESRMVFVRGGGNGELWFNGCGVSVLQDEKSSGAG